MRVLADFGVPLRDLTADDLSHPNVVFQIGVEPSRIDILTSVTGVDFDAGWRNRMSLAIEWLILPITERDGLIPKAVRRAAPRHLPN